jgi:hypothetical protein
MKGQCIGGTSEVEQQIAAKTIVGTAAPPTKQPLEERLNALINQAKVMLFMKGVPAAPECGFSSTMI